MNKNYRIIHKLEQNSEIYYTKAKKLRYKQRIIE
jgi:hypothetical protein